MATALRAMSEDAVEIGALALATITSSIASSGDMCQPTSLIRCLVLTTETFRLLEDDVRERRRLGVRSESMGE